MGTELNPYACLGLMPGSSPAEVKRRYRQMAKQYHPDCNGHTPDCEAKLRELNAARAFLSDPARKSAYDARFGSAFNPLFTPVPTPPPAAFFRSPALRPPAGRRRASLCAMAGLTVLVLLSTGIGLLSNAAKGSPFFPRPQLSSAAADSAPPAVYSFLPSHSPFDPQSSQSSQP